MKIYEEFIYILLLDKEAFDYNIIFPKKNLDEFIPNKNNAIK